MKTQSNLDPNLPAGKKREGGKTISREKKEANISWSVLCRGGGKKRKKRCHYLASEGKEFQLPKEQGKCSYH